MTNEQLFWKLFKSPVEGDVEKVLEKYKLLRNPENWLPYGQNDNNYGVVENQQASPIPALIEKITNGIDAILMRLCQEQGIDPRSEDAPQSIEEALERFYPNHKNWDIRQARREQAESLQILADGPRGQTSLVIFDEGEGQAPEKFEETFLSLLRGNKNDIHFVQGKYNMGGAGAIAFCGKHRYQLICSRRFNAPEQVGFTLVRRHPLSTEEEKTKKSTWYEYLVLDDKIPSFAADELNMGLYNKQFRFGTVIKLYSYDLPSGSRSVISRDLNQSINEYLFNPALPIFTIDTPERYPNDREHRRELYGLRRRLEEDDSKYIEQYFSEDIVDDKIGDIRVTCYVFKSRIDDRSVKETRDTIRREFFKNNMSVLFSVNGQVHGHYTSEFMTRALKFPLLKDCLLISVDCTGVKTEFRNELFMASRDRLKEGEESRHLRHNLASLLSKSRLKEIHKARKASIAVESKDAEDLVRKIARNLPIQNELADLFRQTFNIDNTRGGKTTNKKVKNSKKKENAHEEPAFSPQHYPTFFKADINSKDGNGLPMVGLPLGGERTIRFSTDAEDHYFDRVQDSGDFQISLLSMSSNENEDSHPCPLPNKVNTILNVVTSSPQNGTIKMRMKPTGELNVGDVIKLQASLSSPEKELSQIFLVKITNSTKRQKKPEKGDEPDTELGLPKLIKVYKDDRHGELTWNRLEESNIIMNHEVVVHPYVEGDSLGRIYINMDSKAFLSYRADRTSAEAIDVAEKRYISAVYFHTLFLYTITKNLKYGIIQEMPEKNGEKSVDTPTYISDIFGSFYAQFLLNFDTQELIAALEA